MIKEIDTLRERLRQVSEAAWRVAKGDAAHIPELRNVLELHITAFELRNHCTCGWRGSDAQVLQGKKCPECGTAFSETSSICTRCEAVGTTKYTQGLPPGETCTGCGREGVRIAG